MGGKCLQSVVVVLAVSFFNIAASQNLVNFFRLLRPNATSGADFPRNGLDGFQNSLATLSRSVDPEPGFARQSDGVDSFRRFLSNLSSRNNPPIQEQLLNGSRNFDRFVQTLFARPAAAAPLATPAQPPVPK